MTYIAMPETHDPKTGAAISYAILKQEDEQRIPVSFLRQQDCPVPINKLAENLAAIANGNAPLHRIEGPCKMYYEDIDGGFHLRFRSATEEGVSQIGAVLTHNGGAGASAAQCIAMRRLCRTVVCSTPMNDSTPKQDKSKRTPRP